MKDGVRSMIFSATVPGFIQDLAAKKLKNPILLDLVGDETNQIPERIKHFAVVVPDEAQMWKHIQTYVENNRDKKMIIFTETKQQARMFENQTYASKTLSFIISNRIPHSPWRLRASSKRNQNEEV